MKMINSSAFQIRLFNCHLHMQYASKKNSTILQRPLTIKKKDEGKSKVVVLWKAPSPGVGCCRGRETATSNFFQTDSGGCRYILFKKESNSVDGAPQFSEVFIPVRFGRLIRSRSGSKDGLHMHLHR